MSVSDAEFTHPTGVDWARAEKEECDVYRGVVGRNNYNWRFKAIFITLKYWESAVRDHNHIVVLDCSEQRSWPSDSHRIKG